MKKIVVTGALGHIGSRLIREIPQVFPEAEIVLLDSLATQRYASLFNLPQARYYFIQADILEADLDAVFEGADCVIHLAALTNPEESVRHPDKVERVNLIGTEKVAAACGRTGARLLFPSTTSVYGKQAGSVTEECPDSDLMPQSPYAEFKLRAEKSIRRISRQTRLDFVIARFATIFGVSPGMQFHTAVNRFCWQAATGKPLTVWKTAWNQNRPYLDLADAVRGILFLIERNLFGQNVFNFVTAHETVGSVVRVIQEKIPQAEIQKVESPVMNELSYEVDSSKIRRAGFVFRGNLEKGITETLDLLGPLQTSRTTSITLS